MARASGQVILLTLAFAWSASSFVSDFAHVPAHAHGAVAIGLPQDVGRDGVAMGVSWDHPTESEAMAVALEQCHRFGGVPASTTNLCKSVTTFENQCVAAAFDPEAGTPGYGWAVAGSTDEARSKALASCRLTAGKTREQYCEVTTARCDGTAK